MPNRSNVLDENEELVCSRCGKKLVDNIGLSMISVISDKNDKIVSFKPCCKGKCDEQLKMNGFSNDYKELHDLMNPYGYLKYIMGIMNSMYEKNIFANEEAFSEFKTTMITIYPYVTRNMTEHEKESERMSAMLPF